MAAPLQHVHDQVRRVRELEEEDLLGRDVADPGRVPAAREDVERVQAGAEARVVAGLRDPPRVVVVAHVAPPGKRLVGDADAVRAGALGQRAQLGGGEIVVVDRLRGDVRAHQQHSRAQLVHDLELGLGAPEVRREPLLGHRLEVPQGLVHGDLEPERVGAPADLRGPFRRGDEVRLEQLDGVEARGRRGRELVVERAAEADGGDRPARPFSHPRAAPRRVRLPLLVVPVPIGTPHTAWAMSSSTWPSIRSRSGRAPVNSSSDPAACSATIAAPSSVRQPHARASSNSCVSIGM